MGTPLYQVNPPVSTGSPVLRLFPVVSLALFLAPVAAGLVATALPAFGYLPALGGQAIGMDSWRKLLATPGIGASVRLTLQTGILATVLALAIVIGFCSVMHDTRLFRRTQVVLSPLLATPHVAVAIGLAFLIAPGGWASRLASPWLTGWERPPDVAVVHDAAGLSFVLGLLLKEVPYLMLMTFGALNQVRSTETLVTARSLGYAPTAAWLRTILPQVYPQIRLPIYAVLAFSMSVVDVAVVLAPTHSPPLSVLLFRMFTDRDLALVFPAAAGACLQLAAVAAAIGLWRAAEILVSVASRRWLTGGGRKKAARPLSGVWAAVMGAIVALSGLGTVSLVIWSLARTWFFPKALPAAWTLSHWGRHAPDLVWPGAVTFATGLAASLIGLVLAVGCLQNERVNGLGSAARALWLLYTPLLVPQIAFLFGAQMLLVRMNLDGTWIALVWSHLLFVFPYVFLSLADPWRSFDLRYRTSALALTGSPLRTFLRVEMPLMLKPALFALAIGFAVSVGQYLPTIFAGGGRFTTLTVEAVTLSSGNDPRVTGIYALLQAAFPLGMYLLAIAAPAWRYRHRKGMA
jgi:putative thiamine transport system permease protein